MNPLVARFNGCSKVCTQTIITQPGGSSPPRVQFYIAGIPSCYGNADSYNHIHVNTYSDSDSDAYSNRYTDEYTHADRDIDPDDYAHADDQPDSDFRFP